MWKSQFTLIMKSQKNENTKLVSNGRESRLILFMLTIKFYTLNIQSYLYAAFNFNSNQGKIHTEPHKQMQHKWSKYQKILCGYLLIYVWTVALVASGEH